MPEIVLVKREPIELEERDRDVVRRVLFQCLAGLGELHARRWRRLWNHLIRAEIGEAVTFTTLQKRVGVFHRRHMLIETRVFEAQERIEDFEQFRVWLKIGSGFVDWMAGPKGGVVPVPKSISYAQCEEGVFREFHEAAIAFLRSPHAVGYLWPKLPAQQQSDAIEAILSPFKE